MIGRGALGDGGLDLAGVDLERLGVGIDEDRQGVVQQNHVDRGDEGVGRHDHFVARPDAQAPSEVNSALVPLLVATQYLAPVSLA